MSHGLLTLNDRKPGRVREGTLLVLALTTAVGTMGLAAGRPDTVRFRRKPGC
jgi:hypothetical protein